MSDYLFLKNYFTHCDVENAFEKVAEAFKKQDQVIADLRKQIDNLSELVDDLKADLRSSNIL